MSRTSLVAATATARAPPNLDVRVRLMSAQAMARDGLDKAPEIVATRTADGPLIEEQPKGQSLRCNYVAQAQFDAPGGWVDR
jgi:hypothetical protein